MFCWWWHGALLGVYSDKWGVGLSEIWEWKMRSIWESPNMDDKMVSIVNGSIHFKQEYVWIDDPQEYFRNQRSSVWCHHKCQGALTEHKTTYFQQQCRWDRCVQNNGYKLLCFVFVSITEALALSKQNLKGYTVLSYWICWYESGVLHCNLGVIEQSQKN